MAEECIRELRSVGCNIFREALGSICNTLYPRTTELVFLGGFIGCLGPTMKGRHFCDGSGMASGVTSSEGWFGKIHLDSQILWGGWRLIQSDMDWKLSPRDPQSPQAT